MTNHASSGGIAHLTDPELLTLYLSLAPAARERTFVRTVRAAEMTGVSMRTIQLWIEIGSVRAIVVGGKYRIVVDSLKAHLESQMDKWSMKGTGRTDLAKRT